MYIYIYLKIIHVIRLMNNSLYSELKSTSDQNYESKSDVREEHSKLKDDEYINRDNAMVKASGELFDQIMQNGLIENMKKRAEDGYYEMLIFAVSLDPSMDTFATHESNKPYMVTEYNGTTYTFTYRSLFWTGRWKELFGNFNLNYRWNKPQTLLSVYVSWSR